MTTNSINCEGFTDRLMAYLEHELDDAAHASVERHALTCDDCGALLADLRKLRVDAANLPELAPSRDLWTGIAARIEAPVVPIGGARQPMVPRVRARRWLNGAAIAASLVAAAGVGYVAASGRSLRVEPTPPARVADVVEMAPVVAADHDSSLASTTPPTAPPTSRLASAARAEPSAENRVASAQLAVATLTADYNREVVRLRGLIEERRNQLDPVTVAIIEKNLQVIDAAIVECQRAIARDPSSRFLIESLNQSLQTKVELMRTAALLPSRT